MGIRDDGKTKSQRDYEGPPAGNTGPAEKMFSQKGFSGTAKKDLAAKAVVHEAVLFRTLLKQARSLPCHAGTEDLA